jgi:predicted ABC-type transport system involved in lysophospholipase L1 biosynthesis ATPase subunit
MPEPEKRAAPSGVLPAVQLRNVVKDYQSLRPLRVRQLDVGPEGAVALMGFDAPASEVFVNLLTAASLPDTGEVLVFGSPTRAIDRHTEWMALLDRFGLISARSVLLDQLTAEQNLAIPFTLTVESMPDGVRRQVHRLADEIGLTSHQLQQSTSALSPDGVLRVRLGRALALDPQVLLAEHPNASVSREDALAFARDLSRIRRDRRIASIVLTADRKFAELACDEILTLSAATGELKADTSAWSRLFRF